MLIGGCFTFPTTYIPTYIGGREGKIEPTVGAIGVAPLCRGLT